MDLVFHYCEKCGRRVPEQDWTVKTATLAGRHATCGNCNQAAAGEFGVVPAESQHIDSTPDANAVQSATNLHPSSRASRKKLLALGIASALAVVAAVLAVTLLFLPGETDSMEQHASPIEDGPGETAALPKAEAKEDSSVSEKKTLDSSIEIATQRPVELTAEERFRRRLAAEELASLRARWKEQPEDRERFYYQVWQLMENYKGTPAADEALQWWTELDVPETFTAQINWPQDWDTETEQPRTKLLDEWDERYFVLETHPSSIDQPIRLTRTILVPKGKPFLVCPVRGHEQGDSEVWVEVNGKPSPRRKVAAGKWQRLSVDLSESVGQDVTVSIVNQATGWLNEYAYWQMPRFAEHAPAGAATERLLQEDIVRTKRREPDPAAVEEPEEYAVNWKRAVSLLAMVDPKRDTFTGQWRLVDGALECNRTSPARLMFPYRPADEYDMRVTFTVKENLQAVTLLLSRGDRNFICTMGAWENTIGGFGLVDRKKPNDNPTTVKQSFFEIGKRYSMTVRVREAGLKAYLNGVLITQLKTDYRNVTSDPDWKTDAARQLWLGLGTWDTRVVFHSAELAELSGRGKKQLLPNGLLVSDLPNSERAVMARWLGDLTDLLQRERYEEARQRLSRLMSSPPSRKAKSALAGDARALDVAKRLLKKAPDGFAKLTDGRPFELFMVDGEKRIVGANHPNRIVSVEDGRVEMEMIQGAGKVTQRLHPDRFALRTQVDMALLVLGHDPAALPEQAVGAVLRYRDGALGPTTAKIRNQLGALGKKKEYAALAQRLQEWLDQAKREHVARFDYATLQRMATVRLFKDLPVAAADFEKKHRETATYADVLLEFRRLRKIPATPVVTEPPKTQPGLWAMYYSGDANNKFRRFHNARPEGRSALDWRKGSPMRGVPADFFGVRFRGALRIKKAGVYQFHITADDELEFWLSGRKLCSFVGGKGAQFTVRLAAGDHDLKLYYAEQTGEAKLNVRWKPPGAKRLSNIPASALVHRPSAVASYRKN